MSCWLLLQVLQEARSWHTTKGKLSGNSLRGTVHPQQLSLTLRVWFEQPKPRWKLTAAESNSSAAASPPPKKQSLPLCLNSCIFLTHHTTPALLARLAERYLESSLFPPHQNPLSVSLGKLNQAFTWTEECWGNNFYKVAGGTQTDRHPKLDEALSAL